MKSPVIVTLTSLGNFHNMHIKTTIGFISFLHCNSTNMPLTSVKTVVLPCFYSLWVIQSHFQIYSMGRTIYRPFFSKPLKTIH